MAEIDEAALATLDRAGIRPEGGGSLAELMCELDARVQRQLEETPEIAEIATAEDYRYCKGALAALRKASREVDDARKGMTRELDAAKKAITSFFRDCASPLEGPIERMAALQRSYEDAAREAKRGRLEAWWEQSYPMLALCTGEAAEPLVPFERVFDPDWVRRLGEVNDDSKAREAMAAIADGIADAQSEIEAAGLGPGVRSLALSRLFDTLEPSGAIAWAVEEDRRRRDVERVQAATVPEAAPMVPEPAEAPQAAPEPPAQAAPGRHRAELDMPCEPGARRVLVVWADDDDDLAAGMAAMRGAGLHGCVGKVVA